MFTFVFVVFLWILSVCLHEFAHAKVAYDGGDLSVKDKGYLTLNPLKYLDPMMSVVMPVVFLMLGGIGLPGAAVYIDTSKLRSTAWQLAVALAGPGMNLALLMVIGMLLSQSLVSADLRPALAFVGLLQASAVVLNLLPIPGFDGYGALAPHLPPSFRAQFEQFARHGIWVLFLLLFFVPPFARAFWGIVRILAEAFGVPMATAFAGYDQFRFWD